jgi:beta-glucanase (GH16 family)
MPLHLAGHAHPRVRTAAWLVPIVATSVVALVMQTSTRAVSSAAAVTTPVLDHVFTVLMENQDYGSIIGNSQAPYINRLASQGTLATNYHAVAHPSLPNYLALTGGVSYASNSCVSSDGDPTGSCLQTAPSIADPIEASGRTWKGYMESMPAPCTLSNSGNYAVRHNPFVYYQAIQSTARCNNDVPYSALATDLQATATTPSYAWVTPNVINDMHDGTVAQGDAWLQANLPNIFNSPAWTTQHSILMLVWDENNGAAGNQIPAIILGSPGTGVNVGATTSVNYTHYSLLRTVDWLWNLTPVGAGDTAATPMSDVFATAPPPTTTTTNSPTTTTTNTTTVSTTTTTTPSTTTTTAPTTTTTTTPAPSTNLALNKPTIASSSESAALRAVKATDGNLGTRWASKQGADPQWIRVDLGAVYTIREVKLTWETAFAKAYKIQVSNDASTWTTIFSTTTGTGGVNDLTVLSGSGRYIRMFGTVRGTQWGYSLWEFAVYSTTTPPPSTTTTILATTTTTVASTNPQPTGIAGNWTMMFNDEFSGSSVDSSKWTANWLGAPGAITPPVNSLETECYDPHQATVANGELDLTAINATCNVGGKTFAYKSGMVQSNGKFSFTHGAFEARIWTPAGTGMWPAFWTDGQSWPNDGEIDVLEAYGDDNSSYHYHYAGCGGDCGPGDSAVVTGATAGWHTYSANWQSDTITWYYDGKPVWSYPTQTNSPMYLILNLGLNSSSPAVPATMRVDYVRVWQ